TGPTMIRKSGGEKQFVKSVTRETHWPLGIRGFDTIADYQKPLASTAHRSHSRVAISQLVRFCAFFRCVSNTGTATVAMAPHLPDWVCSGTWCTLCPSRNCRNGQT